MRFLARIAGAFFLFLVVTAAPAAAQMRHSAPGTPASMGGPPRCGNDLAQSVGLTAAQTTALETLRSQTLQSIDAVLAPGKTIHDALDAALASSTPDRCGIGDLAIQLAGVRQQIETIRSNAEATFVASLTADQQAKYATFLTANPGCAAFPSERPAFRGRAL